MKTKIFAIVSLIFNYHSCSIFSPDPCNLNLGQESRSEKEISEEFSNCEETSNSLSISLSKLKNFDFLKNLKKINGGIYISENANLTNIEGLGNVEYIEGPISIRENPKLRSLKGLEGLEVVHSTKSQSVYISLNRLSNLTGLDNLKKVIGDNAGVVIYDTHLTSLRGLESLEVVNGMIDIYGDNLASISSLKSLRYVDQQIEIGATSCDLTQAEIDEFIAKYGPKLQTWINISTDCYSGVYPEEDVSGSNK